MKEKIETGNVFQRILFKNKWVLMPFLYGLTLAMVLYCLKFIGELAHLVIHFQTLSENEMMLAMLGLIDVTMIAFLIKMIITGGYQSFVEKVPENTEKISSGLLKVKMGTSLIGVSSIHLLRVFISSGEVTDRQLYIMFSIHIAFLVGALVLAIIDMIHSKSEYWEAQAEAIAHKNLKD
jgi:uncharacterized protein (TIGR00645 family)